MPELPEVETVRRTLETKIIDKTIKNVDVYYDKMLEDIDKDTFVKKLVGEKITALFRYGKYLVFICEHISLVSHLRMEGKFFIKEEQDALEKHEHIVFNFDDGMSLRYHDTRKFGIMAIIDSVSIDDIMKYKGIKKLGEEANVSTNYGLLYEKIKNKNLPIKTLLLDQENLAGLGNIYVDEVCFKSHLHPLTKGREITLEQTKIILENARSILANAIECGGTTIRSYTSSLGVTGRFQINLNVHTKEGKPCPKCQTLIKKIRVGGRGTYYCPTCQVLTSEVKMVGVTGIISSGKTMVTDYLQKQGYVVIDADVISRSLLEKGSQYLELIINSLIKLWGKELVDTFYLDGFVSRKALGKIIFEDSTKREDLNSLMHPIIKKIIILKINEQKNVIIKNNLPKIIFISVPLLIEAAYDDLCDIVLIVSSNIEIIKKRLMSRDNISEEYALQKIASQMSLAEKIQICECKNKPYIVLENNGTMEETYQVINTILKQF